MNDFNAIPSSIFAQTIERSKVNANDCPFGLRLTLSGFSPTGFLKDQEANKKYLGAGGGSKRRVLKPENERRLT